MGVPPPGRYRGEEIAQKNTEKTVEKKVVEPCQIRGRKSVSRRVGKSMEDGR